MESKYQRYNEEIVIKISESLSIYRSASDAAKEMGIDVSGLIKHIKKYRVIKETLEINKCSYKTTCQKKNEVCDKCRYMSLYNQEKRCASCKNGCNQICSSFTKTPLCLSLNKWPYVCNHCSKREKCHLNKYIYDPCLVWKALQNNRSNPRKGSHASEGEFIRLSNLLVPLIKGKHQSLPQVFQTHKEEIRWSYPTILSFIDKGLIPNLKNIDLTKRVKYPKQYKKNKDEPTNFAFLSGRTYDDFIAYISDNPFVEVVEMDTVLSGKEDNTCLLTLLFRKSNFMLAFLLKEKTNEEVKRVFRWIKEQLGIELYKQTFSCVLTDNGSEFADPKSIEIDEETGERICRVFYCDPGKSGQKGKIEKNHVELRKVFPKSVFFSIYSKDDINLALSHINSEPRALLNRNCPGVVAKAFLDIKVINLNNYHFIKPDEVTLHPDLLRKK